MSVNDFEFSIAFWMLEATESDFRRTQNQPKDPSHLASSAAVNHDISNSEDPNLAGWDNLGRTSHSVLYCYFCSH